MLEVNDCYYDLLDNRNRYLGLFGGSGSGKSVFCGQKILDRALNEEKHRILILRKVKETIKNSVFALMLEILGSEELLPYVKINNTDKTITFPNGNQILTAGLDDVEKLKSITGITTVWAEEFTEFTYNDFKQVDLRLRGKNSSYFQYMFSFNPIDRDHWIKDHFFIDEENPKIAKCTLKKTTWRDNIRFLDDEYIEMLQNLEQEDPNYFIIYSEGGWGGKAKGLIYTKYEAIDSFPVGIPYIYAIDFGFNNPTVALKLSLHEGVIYEEELLYRSGMTNADLIQWMKENITREVKEETVQDGTTEIYADSAEPQRIEEIYQAGFNVHKSNKEVKDGLDYCRRFQLKITKSSINSLKEVKTYKWKEDKNGNPLDEPLKFNDHTPDARRYGIFTHYYQQKRPDVRVLDLS